MKRGIKTQIGGWSNIAPIMIGILVFGSIWGLLDAISVGALFSHIGPALRSNQICICPLTSAVFGFFIMAIALAIYKRPMMLIGIGAVAALFKLLNFAILPLPVIGGNVAYQPVVNPALGAFTASIVFALVAALLLNRLESSVSIRVGAGVVAGFLGTVAFVYAAFYLTHTHPLIVDTPWQFIAPLHGPAAAALGAIFLPLGYLVGMKLRERASSLLTARPRFYYLGAGVTSVLCLGISALALMGGL
jgi:hypothetical protein